MRTRLLQFHRRARSKSGLTLVEMLVASTLLLLILLSLMLMFNQTQRAFRTGLRQNDTLETGRAAMDLIARDIEQMSAAYRLDITNAQVQLHSAIDPVRYTPPGGGEKINFLQTFFFLKNQGDWEAMGYRVLNSSPHTNRLEETDNILVGALYSFRTNAPDLTNHLDTFHSSPLHMVTNGTMRRLADGVVHFTVTMYDKEGRIFTNSVLPEIVFHPITQTNLLPGIHLAGSTIPASLDIELGILEPHAIDQLRPLIADGNQAAIRSYLTNNAGKIHIFRRQIPIRTAAR